MKKNYLNAFVLLLSIMTVRVSAQTYCNAAAIYAYDDEIFNVTFGSLNNTSNCSQTGGSGSTLSLYSNYTSVVTAPNVMMGMSYPLSVTVGQCNGYAYGGYVGVWIDYNQNGLFTDPGEQVYMSGYNTWQVTGTTMSAPSVTVPLSATPGTTRMRVIANEGSQPSPCSTSIYYGEVEDYNVNIISPVPCSGTPGANSAVTPTFAICPGSSAVVGLANNYTVSGITYQWQSSTVSAVGPFTAVANATNSSFSTPTLATQTWYQAVITCTNSSGSITSSVSAVLVQNTTTNTVPYCEGFEGINNNNQLPNCSWSATNLGTRALTYLNANTQNRAPHNGNKFASFYYSPYGQSDFFSNGIWLEANVTYSASVWYTTEYYGYTNWNLKLLLATSQSTAGATVIAEASVAVSPSYKALSNTFSVATSGLYYVDVRGTSNGGYAYYLSWDDLCITVPCSLNPVNLGVTASNTVICSGQSVNLTATGADTYVWSNGATGGTLNDTPNSNTTYNVIGTSSITGCASSQNIQVIVNPSPVMGIIASKPTVCAGSPVVLTAFGATSYTWSSGGNNQVLTVNPSATSSYTVLGANAYNCPGQAALTITVNSLPAITVTSPPSICFGESTTLTASGATSYKWMSNSMYIAGNPVVVSPQVSTSYTVEGTDANECTGSYILNMAVDPCTGISKITPSTELRIYPNPTSGAFTIEFSDASEKTISVTDVIGRNVAGVTSSDSKVDINLGTVSNGIYYVKVKSGNTVEVIKIVKN